MTLFIAIPVHADPPEKRLEDLLAKYELYAGAQKNVFKQMRVLNEIAFIFAQYPIPFERRQWVYKRLREIPGPEAAVRLAFKEIETHYIGDDPHNDRNIKSEERDLQGVLDEFHKTLKSDPSQPRDRARTQKLMDILPRIAEFCINHKVSPDTRQQVYDILGHAREYNLAGQARVLQNVIEERYGDPNSQKRAEIEHDIQRLEKAVQLEKNRQGVHDKRMLEMYHQEMAHLRRKLEGLRADPNPGVTSRTIQRIEKVLQESEGLFQTETNLSEKQERVTRNRIKEGVKQNASGALSVTLAQATAKLAESVIENGDLSDFVNHLARLIRDPVGYLISYEGFVLTEYGVKQLGRNAAETHLAKQLAARIAPKLVGYPRLARLVSEFAGAIPASVAMGVMDLAQKIAAKADELELSEKQKATFEIQATDTLVRTAERGILGLYAEAAGQILMDTAAISDTAAHIGKFWGAYALSSGARHLIKAYRFGKSVQKTVALVSTKTGFLEATAVLAGAIAFETIVIDGLIDWWRDGAPQRALEKAASDIEKELYDVEQGKGDEEKLSLAVRNYAMAFEEWEQHGLTRTVIPLLLKAEETADKMHDYTYDSYERIGAGGYGQDIVEKFRFRLYRENLEWHLSQGPHPDTATLGQTTIGKISDERARHILNRDSLQKRWQANEEKVAQIRHEANEAANEAAKEAQKYMKPILESGQELLHQIESLVS